MLRTVLVALVVLYFASLAIEGMIDGMADRVARKVAVDNITSLNTDADERDTDCIDFDSTGMSVKQIEAIAAACYRAKNMSAVNASIPRKRSLLDVLDRLLAHPDLHELTGPLEGRLLIFATARVPFTNLSGRSVYPWSNGPRDAAALLDIVRARAVREELYRIHGHGRFELARKSVGLEDTALADETYRKKLVNFRKRLAKQIGIASQ